jgi:hypothetical protein
MGHQLNRFCLGTFGMGQGSIRGARRVVLHGSRGQLGQYLEIVSDSGAGRRLAQMPADGQFLFIRRNGAFQHDLAIGAGPDRDRGGVTGKAFAEGVKYVSVQDFLRLTGNRGP